MSCFCYTNSIVHPPESEQGEKKECGLRGERPETRTKDSVEEVSSLLLFNLASPAYQCLCIVAFNLTLIYWYT